MKGILLRGNALFGYLNLNDIFCVLDDIPLQYNWLLSLYECNTYLPEIPFGQEYAWIDGKNLLGLVQKNNIQFIWGVFSAFKKDIPLEEVLKYSLPDPEKPQKNSLNNTSFRHPLSEIEIAVEDSSSVFVMAKNEKLIDAIYAYYPLGETKIT